MRLALISPRYGAEITRGAERACWLLAEELSERHSVEVLTTCARDAETWKNDYAEGIDRVRGVVVRRFPVSGGRDQQAFAATTQRLATSAHSRADEVEWLKRSGTTSAALIEFLKRHQRNYDALIFFSYKAGTTIQGLTVAPERSVLFPCATLEPALRFLIAADALAAPAGVGYVSAAEKRLVRAHFSTRPRGEEIVSVGVAAMHETRYPRLIEEPAESEEADEEAPIESIVESTPAHLSGRGVLFRRQHRLHGRFGIYAGVVESNNGVEELLEYFDRYASRGGDLALVMMGVKMMKLPSEPWLRSGGILAERDRLAALEAADVAFAPDPDDILGEQALEAFAAGTPVLASARNAAAVEHIRRGGAGLYYANGDEFVESLRLIMTNDRLRDSLGRAGRRYVLQQHRWDAVLSRLERLLSNLKKAA
jgi:glycosyltransferase involved in cell wall biosynthesis